MQMTGRKEYEFAPVWNNVPCPPYRYENDSYWVTLTHPCESQILKAPPGDGKTGTKFKRTRTRVRAIIVGNNTARKVSVSPPESRAVWGSLST